MPKCAVAMAIVAIHCTCGAFPEYRYSHTMGLQHNDDLQRSEVKRQMSTSKDPDGRTQLWSKCRKDYNVADSIVRNSWKHSTWNDNAKFSAYIMDGLSTSLTYRGNSAHRSLWHSVAYLLGYTHFVHVSQHCIYFSFVFRPISLLSISGSRSGPLY